jgi:cytokinin dehydrogenase
MDSPSSRRSFLRACGLILPVLATEQRPPSRTPFARPLSEISGELLTEDQARRAASDDWGHAVARSPVAVVRPASIEDVARVVRYGNAHRIPIVMRGRGHCAYGQAQVNRGIVIDSSTLRRLAWEHDDLSAEAGAAWDDVAAETLSKGKIPPVMPDMLLLSVGGTLSCGGVGEMSVRCGAQVDHVQALDVVTGTGELVSCSPSHNAELFHMTLAGVGQCAIIARARLRLVDAPAEIALHRLRYSQIDSLLADAAAMAVSNAVDSIGAELTKQSDGWRLELIVGRFLPLRGDLIPELPGGMQSDAHELARLPFIEYLGRRTRSVVAALASDQPNPALILTFGSAAAPTFVRELLFSPELSLGLWRVEVLPLVTSHFVQPLHPMPADSLAFTVRLQRRASARNAQDHQAMLNMNKALVERFVPAGAKIYPPFAPPLSSRQWQLHFAAAWPRFAAAKQRYDPRHILTPGAGIFTRI